MRRSRAIVITAIVVAGLGAGAIALLRAPDGGAGRAEDRWATVEQYCLDCHNDLDRAGEVTFEGLSAESLSAHPELFETVVTKLRGRLMPPPDRDQPAQSEIDALITWLETSIDENAHDEAGFVQAQRLSRAEYAAAVDALLGVKIDPTEYLPTEIEVDGFTNIATGLTVSPAYIEQYLNVAGVVAHLAVGEPQPKVATAYFPPPADNQREYVHGMPLGTRGGIRFTHTFPADGEYRLTVTNLGAGLYPSALETEHTLVILVDRNEAFRDTIGGPDDHALINTGGAPARAEIMSRFANIPLEITAGTHEVAITFIERARAASDEHISTFAPAGSFSFSGAPRVPTIQGGIDLIGPFNATGLSQTPSRELLFICEPEVPARERECAERITTNLARRAFRRPVTQDDLDRLMPFYEQGRQGAGGFDEGIELMTTAVLSSPDFLYRTIAPPTETADSSYALSDFELASRLSFFLWSQGPDDSLLNAAAAGDLREPEALEAQVRRMLADPRAEVLVRNFALPWLTVDDLDSVEPDAQIFAFEFTDALRDDFATEIEMFVASILLEDRDVRDLLRADHTFVNERLARHYDLPAVYGPQFRRIDVADPNRHGLLGKGAVLLRTSYGDRTSPVLRGAWVLEKLMGTPPTPPPPGVETDLTIPEGEPATTVRARLERHRESPTCAGCHGVIDPYGLALENFSAIGSWRVRDESADAPIDASSELPGGQPIDGPVALREALLARPDQFVQALTEKLMMYAIGRELEHFDMPQLRAIVDAAEPDEYRFSRLVAGIVRSDAFLRQAVTAAAGVADNETLNVALNNSVSEETETE